MPTNDNDEHSVFELTGPDEDGHVWITFLEGPDTWSHNLGPYAKVAERFSQWLGENDFQERL